MRGGSKTIPNSTGKNNLKSFQSTEVKAAGDEGNVPPRTMHLINTQPPARRQFPAGICGLTNAQKRRITEYHRKRIKEQDKFIRRMKQIKTKLTMLRKLHMVEQQDMHEFCGDEYERGGGRKKRKKDSARPVSMVPIDVKQKISWWARKNSLNSCSPVTSCTDGDAHTTSILGDTVKSCASPSTH